MLRQDTNHRMRTVTEHDPAPNDVRVASQLAAPERMGDDRDRSPHVVGRKR